MIDNLNREIWQFVKRQRTWFKRNKEIVWLDPTDKKVLEKANKVVGKKLKVLWYNI